MVRDEHIRIRMTTLCSRGTLALVKLPTLNPWPSLSHLSCEPAGTIRYLDDIAVRGIPQALIVGTTVRGACVLRRVVSTYAALHLFPFALAPLVLAGDPCEKQDGYADSNKITYRLLSVSGGVVKTIVDIEDIAVGIVLTGLLVLITIRYLGFRMKHGHSRVWWTIWG